MNWAMWDRIAAVLDELAIQPIVAIVPDNQDPSLNVALARDDFWERVRGWQAAGWFIALHGHQHRYVTQDAGLMGINPFSEFAGLPYETQKLGLASALQIMQSPWREARWLGGSRTFLRCNYGTGVAGVWASTSSATASTGVRWIRLGATWIPQQIWRFRPMPTGVWTVCLHGNTLTEPASRP